MEIVTKTTGSVAQVTITCDEDLVPQITNFAQRLQAEKDSRSPARTYTSGRRVTYQCLRQDGCGFRDSYWEDRLHDPVTGKKIRPHCPLCGRSMLKLKRGTR